MCTNVDAVAAAAVVRRVGHVFVPDALAVLGCASGDIIDMGETPGTFAKDPPDPLSGQAIELGQAQPNLPSDVGEAKGLYLNPRWVG